MGNYSEYQKFIQNKRQEQERTNDKPEKKNKQQSVEKKKEKSLKFTYKEQKEFEQIEDVIAEVEGELEVVQQKINEAGSDYDHCKNY